MIVSPTKTRNGNRNTKKEFMPQIFSITQTSHFCSTSKDFKFCATLNQIVNFPSNVQIFLKPNCSLVLFNSFLRVAVILSAMDISVFLSFFSFTKIFRLQLCRTDLAMIGQGFFLFCFGLPTL